MNKLEQILGSAKFRLLSEDEKLKIEELISANQVYEFLVAGFIGMHDWRKVLDDAHSTYVRPSNTSKKGKASTAGIQALTEEKTQRVVLFGTTDFDSFSKSGILI